MRNVRWALWTSNHVNLSFLGTFGMLCWYSFYKRWNMWLSKHLVSLISHFFFLIFYPEMIIFPRVCHCVMRSIFSGKLQCELYIRVSFSTFESRVGRLIRFLRSIKADYKEKIISEKEKLSYRILMSRKRLGLEMQWCH